MAADCVNCAHAQAVPPVVDLDSVRRLNPGHTTSLVPSDEPITIEIETPELERDAGATYCRRDPNVVDTIVFHHTETSSLTTVQQINQMHLDRGSAADPWLMIGYHYTINSSYVSYPRNGWNTPQPRISQGRPFNIAGSHAGTDVFKPASQETQTLMAQDGAIRCGRASGPLEEADDKFNSQGHVKANYNTVAITVIGNYAVRSSSNPGGYPANRPRTPTSQTIDMAAQLACQLQKEHPRIVNIKWHSFYKATSCPGLIRNQIEAIKRRAVRYGCTFN